MNLETLIRNNVKTMQPYASARDEFKETNRDMVFLDANENPFATCANRYPDPQQLALKQKLADLKLVAVENILLGNGSDEVLDLIFRAFCEPNSDSVLITPPTYGMYEVLANLNALNIQKVLLNEDFQLNVKAILDSISSGTKLLCLCSPNNPTGNLLSANDIETLLKSFNGLVLIDEAYIDFSETVSWVSRLEEFPNLIVTQTLSKAYAMAGVRLGICYASSDIIRILNKIKPPYNINQLTLDYVLNNLETSKVQEQTAILLTEKEKLIKALSALQYVGTVYPSDANFVLVQVDNATARYRQLLENGIVVRNRTNQPLCENCLRISIGTPSENELLISVMKTLR